MGKWKDFFKGKRVTVMGLGLLGRGLGDALFLARNGAELVVTDLRDEKALAPSLAKLKSLRGIRYALGEHRLGDFRNKDFILKAAGVPLDSRYLAEARKNGIPIEMDASLFAAHMPEGVALVGVTGTRGKSTVTALICKILSSWVRSRTPKAGSGSPPRVFCGGNLVPEATLPLLARVRAGDIVVLELDSWQLQGFRDAKISPQVAVFTSFLDDHLLYYRGSRKRYFEDKAAIFAFQKKGGTLVVGEQAAPRVSAARPPVEPIVARVFDVPQRWNIKLPGAHNRANVACALAVARVFKVPEAVIRKAAENFKGIHGRLEFMREVNGVKIYNDNNATTPDATTAALRALSTKSKTPHPKQIPNSQFPIPKRIILIMGGTDKGLDMSKLINEIQKHCKAVVLLKETGTRKIRSKIYDLRFKDKNLVVREADGPKECVETAMNLAKKGDIVLFSPAFASFGKRFKNEYDRGEQFVGIVNAL